MRVDDSNSNDDEIEKTLAIIIGLIAAVALIIVFISFLNKLCDDEKGIIIILHLSFLPSVLFLCLKICSFCYITLKISIPFCCISFAGRK